MKNEEIRNVKNFDELLDKKYGKFGTRRRDVFEEQAQYYLSTLYRIFESGLGKQINLFIG